MLYSINWGTVTSRYFGHQTGQRDNRNTSTCHDQSSVSTEAYKTKTKFLQMISKPIKQKTYYMHTIYVNKKLMQVFCDYKSRTDKPNSIEFFGFVRLVV